MKLHKLSIRKPATSGCNSITVALFPDGSFIVQEWWTYVNNDEVERWIKFHAPGAYAVMTSEVGVEIVSECTRTTVRELEDEEANDTNKEAQG